MKNRFSKSLLVSVLSLVLCCAMLAGTTFAWFTDEVSGTGNRIKTGTLKIDVIANGDKLVDGEDKPIFSYENWEPGYTAVATVEVVNNGSLAFDWRMVMTTDAVAGDVNLADMIEVYTTNARVDSTEDMSIADIKAENSGWTKLGVLTDYLNQEKYVIEGSLTTRTSAPRTIALHMIEEAGNEYQDCELGNIYIVFEAKQDTVEEDAFNNQYDEDALWHDGWDGSIDTAWYDNAVEGTTEFILSSPSELAGLAQLVNAGNDFDNITIKLGADMNLGNRLWTPIGKDGAAFNGTLDGDGYVISNLKIVQKDTAYCGLVGKATTYAELKNIAIDGANIDAYKYVGAILGHGYASIVNCTVKNATIRAIDVNGEKGDKAGAIVGYRAEGKSLKFIGNTAENVEIVANRQAGQLIGYMHEYNAEKDYGNRAINVTVTWSGYGSNEDVNQRLYGAGTGSEATE